MTDNRKARAKHFQISKCKKGIKQRQSLNKRSKRRRKYIASRSYVHNVSYRQQHPFSALQQSTHRLIAPAFLSISDNPDETLNFFDYVSRTVERCKRGDHLFFDLSQIVTITPDAIMYLIAFINNAKRIRALQISSSGNLPNDTGAKDIMLKTGFYSHVKSRFQEMPETDNNYMKISSGKDADGNLASAFCDFVQEKCSQGMSGTKKLYPIIIELMTNTHQHAYKDRLKSIMDNKWYVFAQADNGKVHFVFLDTGVGIPTTVKKNFFEKTKDLLVSNDSWYIESALNGDFRTETNEKYRGKGLPGIYEDACQNAITNLCIVSGKGKCEVTGENIKSAKLNNNFEGTLFSWDIICSKGA